MGGTTNENNPQGVRCPSHVSQPR